MKVVEAIAKVLKAEGVEILFGWHGDIDVVDVACHSGGICVSAPARPIVRALGPLGHDRLDRRDHGRHDAPRRHRRDQLDALADRHGLARRRRAAGAGRADLSPVPNELPLLRFADRQSSPLLRQEPPR